MLAAVSHPRRALARVQEAVAAGSVLAGFALERSAPFPWNGPLGAARSIRWQSFDLERLLAMRGAAGCKVNDIALAVIAGALQAILPPSALAPGRRARALVPVSIVSPTSISPSATACPAVSHRCRSTCAIRSSGYG